MSRPHPLRKKILVDVPMQMSVSFAVFGALIALSLIYVVAMFLFSQDGTTLEDPTSAEANRLGYLVTGLYFLVVLAAVVLVSIRATHRIAGPAMLIERAVRGALEGDYDQRLNLRHKDHLQSLAAAVGELRRKVQADEEQRTKFHQGLEEAFARGDHERARELNRAYSSDGRVEEEDRAA